MILFGHLQSKHLLYRKATYKYCISISSASQKHTPQKLPPLRGPNHLRWKKKTANKIYSTPRHQKGAFSYWFALLSTDGLVDCMDPDCCLQSSCQSQPYCRGLPDPQDIISQSLQSPSQQAAKSFYDRISFLIGSESTHVIPGESPFNKRFVLLFLL